MCFDKCDNIGERNQFTCPSEIEALVSAGPGDPGVGVGDYLLSSHLISYHSMITPIWYLFSSSILSLNDHLVRGLVVSARAWCTVVTCLLVHLVHSNTFISIFQKISPNEVIQYQYIFHHCSVIIRTFWPDDWPWLVRRFLLVRAKRGAEALAGTPFVKIIIFWEVLMMTYWDDVDNDDTRCWDTGRNIFR